jgi:glycosyltransferase involved in cell wall biosynthesis
MEKPKIKLAHIITRFVCGGAENVVVSLASALDREKYQIVIVTGELCDSEKGLKAVLDKNNIELITIKQMVRRVSIAQDILAAVRLYFLIRNKGIDIIHTHTSKAGALGRIAAFLAKVPVIVHSPHGNIFEPKGNIPGVSESPLARLIFLFIERLLAKFTDKIIVLSDNERRQYIALKIDQPDKFVTIYDGIDYEKFSSGTTSVAREDFGLRDDEPVIGTIGRLDPEKGQVYLIQSAAALLKEYPRLKFLIVGEGSCRRQLEAYAAELGIRDALRFLGLRKDVSQLLSVMDIFVLPSLYEGLGIAVLEAMARSLPVIASRVGGVPEIIDDGVTGILVAPADPRAIAEAIRLLLRNREKAYTLGANACERVKKNFGINLMVEKIEKLYNTLLYSKGGISG